MMIKKPKKKIPRTYTDIWLIQKIMNGGNVKLHSRHESLEDANKDAKGFWDGYTDIDNMEVHCDEPGMPYDAFACVGMGAASYMIFVEEAPLHSLLVGHLDFV